MRRSLCRLATLTAFVAVMAACSDDSGLVGFMEPPTASVTVASVVAGEIVPIRLENRSAVAWTYSLCWNARLQRRDGDQWTTLPPPFVMCLTELSVLLPGDAVDEELYVPLGTESGTHRALVIFDLDGSEAERATNSFEVVGEIGEPSGAPAAARSPAP